MEYYVEIIPSLSVDKERSPSDGRAGHEARVGVGDRLFFSGHIYRWIPRGASARP
jgi:hypothetical protein